MFCHPFSTGPPLGNEHAAPFRNHPRVVTDRHREAPIHILGSTVSKKVSTTMCAKYGSVSRALLLSAAVMGFVTACQRQTGLDHKLQEMAVIAQRDSLLGEVQDELAKVQPKPAGGTPESPALEVTTDQRTFVMERVREVTKRVKDLQTRLANSEKRAGKLSRQADSLGAEFSSAKATIDDLNALVATQR